MVSCDLLWLDCAARRSQPALFEKVAARFCVRCAAALQAREDPGNLPEASAVVCDYDRPEREGLESLHRVKLRWPTKPVLMLTVQHSERLAVWALRNRVWDYVVKPVREVLLCDRLAEALRSTELPGRAARQPVPWYEPIAEPATPQPPWSAASMASARLLPQAPPAPMRSLPGERYILEHYQEKVSMAAAAERCGLDPFAFSRQFKREHGVTFRDFVVQYRIDVASTMLTTTDASVTDVAFSVGFSDLSYFARMFRRYTGHPPSRFRRRSEPLTYAIPEPPATPPAGTCGTANPPPKNQFEYSERSVSP